jgi:putative salt-induced outer membrane protein YdiY
MIPTLLLPLLLSSGPAPEALAPMPVLEPLVEEAENGWAGSITAGALIQTGNTETTTLNATGNATWTDKPNRFVANALWNYQEDKVNVLQRKLYGDAQYDRFYSEKLFAYGKGSADNDYQANLDLRWTLGAGAGYQFRDDDSWKLEGELGLAYVDESFRSGNSNGYVAARVAYLWEWLSNEYFLAGQTGEVFPSLEDSDDIYGRMDTFASTNLTESIFLKLQWIWTYDNTPDEGNERSDNLYSLTVGWSF